MSRYIYEIILFLLPFVSYAIFLWATDRGWRAPERWGGVPLAWLISSAIVLVAASLFYAAMTAGFTAGGVYVPAHVDEAGQLVPGRTVQPEP